MSTTVVTAKQTWRKIKRKVITPTVSRVDVEIDNLRSGEFERYRRWVVDHVGQLPLNGFVQEPLQPYFVPPHLTYQKGPTKPGLKMPRRLRNGRYPLPSFLEVRKIYKHKLLITGEPGMGKTTLLRHLAWQTAQDGLINPNQRIPFLLIARPLIESLQHQPHKNLFHLILEQLNMAGFSAKKYWIAEQLRKGRCLLLIDGLDEIVEHEAWATLIRWLDEQVALYKRNQFVATTRPFVGNSDLLETWTTLALQPFNAEQLSRFMQVWSVTRHQEWMRVLQQPFLKHVAASPLLLTLLRLTEQPTTTSEIGLLGQLFTQRLADSRDPDPVSQILEAHLRRFMLAQLAYEMMVAGQIYLSDEELARTFGEAEDWFYESGVMVRTAVGLTRFSHSLFQSYLTAVHIRAHNLEESMWSHLDERWWHDTIRLYAQDKSPEQLIAHCLSATQPTIERLHLVHATLKATPDLPPKLIEDIPRLLWHNGSGSALQHRLLAELLLTARFERADVDTATGGLLVSHAEYQLFVDDMQAHGRFSQPDHWLAYNFPKGQATRPVVGTRAIDANGFCQWLNERQNGSSFVQYRLPRPGELNGRLYAQVKNQPGVAYWVDNGDGIALETLTPAAPAAEILQRQLARDLTRAYPHAHAAGFRFQETIPLILNPSRAGCLNVPDLFLPEFDQMLVESLAVLEDYERMNQIGTQLESEEVWAQVREQLNGRLRTLAHVIAKILQISPQQVQEFTQNLPRTAELAKQRSLDPLPILARQFTRFYALILAASLQSVWLLQRQYLSSSADILYRDKIELWQRQVAESVTTYLDIYTDMVILDERKAGNLLATEGICLVGDPALSLD